MAPGQTNLLGTKSFTGARYTAVGQNYNTTMSRIESEFAGEQTGKISITLIIFEGSIT